MTTRPPRRRQPGVRLFLPPLLLALAGATGSASAAPQASTPTSSAPTSSSTGAASATASATTAPSTTQGSSTAPGPTPPAGPVHLAPASITADCSVDVTAQLTSWIASVPDGSTLRMAPGRCYRIEGTVLVKDRVGLTLDGNGSTFRAFTVGTGTAAQIQTRNHFRFYGGRDLVLRNLTIRGVNTAHRYLSAYAGHHAFALVGVTNALIENTTVSEVYGDFVLVQADLYRTWRWSDGVVVRNNTFEFAGRQGISVVGGRNVTVSSNRLHGTGITVIDIEPDGRTTYDAQGFPTGGGASDVKIVGNAVSGPVGGIFFSAGGYPGRVDRVEVSDNRLDGVRFFAWVTGTRDVPRTGFTFARNVSNTPTGGPRSAFELTYVEGATITANTVPSFVKTYAKLPPDKTAVKMAGATGVRIAENDFTGAARVVQVDGDWYGTTWTGSPSTQWSHCGNRYWFPEARYDAAC